MNSFVTEQPGMRMRRMPTLAMWLAPNQIRKRSRP
jgi:hypothetical protein